MIMMILYNTNIINKIEEWFIFDLASVNLFLMVYKRLKAETTVAKTKGTDCLVLEEYIFIN